jgi:hypothetical protein
MLEYLSFPSLVNLRIKKPRWLRLLQQDLDSRAEQLTALVKQQEKQQEEKEYQASWMEYGEDQTAMRALFQVHKKSLKKVRAVRQEDRDRMGPVLWEQQCAASKAEMQEFVQNYGQHPYSVKQLDDICNYYSGAPYPSEYYRPLDCYLRLLEEQNVREEDQVIYEWERKIRETLEELACIQRCSNRLHYGPKPLPRSVFAR